MINTTIFGEIRNELKESLSDFISFAAEEGLSDTLLIDCSLITSLDESFEKYLNEGKKIVLVAPTQNHLDKVAEVFPFTFPANPEALVLNRDSSGKYHVGCVSNQEPTSYEIELPNNEDVPEKTTVLSTSMPLGKNISRLAASMYTADDTPSLYPPNGAIFGTCHFRTPINVRFDFNNQTVLSSQSCGGYIDNDFYLYKEDGATPPVYWIILKQSTSFNVGEMIVNDLKYKALYLGDFKISTNMNISNPQGSMSLSNSYNAPHSGLTGPNVQVLVKQTMNMSQNSGGGTQVAPFTAYDTSIFSLADWQVNNISTPNSCGWEFYQINPWNSLTDYSTNKEMINPDTNMLKNLSAISTSNLSTCTYSVWRVDNVDSTINSLNVEFTNKISVNMNYASCPFVNPDGTPSKAGDFFTRNNEPSPSYTFDIFKVLKDQTSK